ncbi:hypothetical protein EDD21DRAFT_437405, partial [Dissophora ornata]
SAGRLGRIYPLPRSSSSVASLRGFNKAYGPPMQRTDCTKPLRRNRTKLSNHRPNDDVSVGRRNRRRQFSRHDRASTSPVIAPVMSQQPAPQANSSTDTTTTTTTISPSTVLHYRYRRQRHFLFMDDVDNELSSSSLYEKKKKRKGTVQKLFEPFKKPSLVILQAIYRNSVRMVRQSFDRSMVGWLFHQYRRRFDYDYGYKDIYRIVPEPGDGQGPDESDTPPSRIHAYGIKPHRTYTQFKRWVGPYRERRQRRVELEQRRSMKRWIRSRTWLSLREFWTLVAAKASPIAYEILRAYPKETREEEEQRLYKEEGMPEWDENKLYVEELLMMNDDDWMVVAAVVDHAVQLKDSRIGVVRPRAREALEHRLWMLRYSRTAVCGCRGP